jgi:hypothetical protein
MNIDYLIQLLTNRLNGLTLAKDQAFQSGDLERINAVDAEILDVQNTLSKLRLVSTIEQTAAVTTFSEAEVVKNGIEASFNPSIIDDSTKCLFEYDITPYATDPYHEVKIQNILEKMGVMDSSMKIESYIKKANPDSPLNGHMVWNAGQIYQVDIRLMLALMELDSRFGTLGVAVNTNNPGNIGNTGTNTRNYPSWEEGVNAVAEWLSRHRKENIISPVENPVETPIDPVVNDPTPVDINIDNTPVENPVETPIDPVVNDPTPVDINIDNTPVENPVETPIDPIIQIPVDDSLNTTTPTNTETVVSMIKKNSKRRIA